MIIIKIIMTLITMTSRRNNMEIKDTLDWTRNWSSKFAWKHFIKYHKHYKEKIKTTTERKKKKTSRCSTFSGPLSQEWIKGRYWSLLWYATLTKLINITKLWFRVLLESCPCRLYWIDPQRPWYKTTWCTRTKKPLN